MNVKQMRQVLEEVLGYYDYSKDGNGDWVRTEAASPPGSYYMNGQKISPAFFVQGRQRIPSNWDIKGLEAVLVEVPKTHVSISVGLTKRTQYWTLYLNQFDEDKTILDELTKVLRHFGGEADADFYKRGDEALADRVRINIKDCDLDLVYEPLDTNRTSNVPSPVENSGQLTFFDQ